MSLGVSLITASSSYATTVEFGYTGSAQSFLVPNLVNTIFVEAWGAQGWSGSNSGGLGGFTSGYLSTTSGETLWIYVGGQGAQANGDRVPGGGGFNGGGDGQNNHTTSSTTCCSGGGGGATDVRQILDDLSHRVIVAGGGGGSTNNSGGYGGAGGGLIGGTAGLTASIYPGGEGGSQVAGGDLGGLFGLGGSATPDLIPWNGGGGGGWYGGGTSAAHAGGGGGSSYVGGVNNSYLEQGLWNGDGFLRFTYEISASESIPLPPTIIILLTGLFGLGYQRYKQQK